MRKPATSYKALVIILAAAVLAAWPPCTAAARLPPRREMLFFLNPDWGLCWQYTLRSHDCAVDTFTSFFAFRPLRLSTGCCNALRGIDNNCILSWLNPLLPLFKARCRSTRGGVGHDVDKEESPVGALNPSAPVGGSVSSSASVGEPPKPEEAKGGKDVQGNAPAVPPAVDQSIGPSTGGFSTPPSARGIEPVAGPGVAPSSSHVEGVEPPPSPLINSHAVAPISPHGEEEPFSNGDRGIEPSPSPLTSSHVAAPTSSHGEEEPFSNGDRGIEPSPSPLTSSHVAAPTSSHGEEEPFSNGDRGIEPSPSPLTSSHVAAPTSSHGEEEPFSNGDQGIEPSPPPLEPIHTGNGIVPSPSPSSAPNSNGDDGIIGPSSEQGDLLSSSARAPSSSSGAQEPFPNGDQWIEPSLSPLEGGLAPRSRIVPGPIF